MIAVALAAFAGGGYRVVVTIQERVKDYIRSARHHEISRQLSEVEADAPWLPWKERVAAKKARDWHAARRDLYKHAAAHPWRTVPPSTPPVNYAAVP